jgi:hypothetical protein
MTKAITVTATETPQNLYALILAALGITQLPQRVDLGAVFFPDFVNTIIFNTAENFNILDQNGNLIIDDATSQPPFQLVGVSNNISLQALEVESVTGSIGVNVTVIWS